GELSSCYLVTRSPCHLVGQRAAWELERCDPCAPVEGAAGLQVLVGIPEGAIVNGIDCHCRVVAPATQVRELGAIAGDDAVFGLDSVQRISRQAARVANAWPYTAARRAIAERDVALLVHGDTAHPAVYSVGGRECPLLEDRRCPAWITQFVPANR